MGLLSKAGFFGERALTEGIAAGEPGEEIGVPLTAAVLVGVVPVAVLGWRAFQPERSPEEVRGALSPLSRGG